MTARAHGNLLLVVLSEQYLAAVRHDVAAAADVLGDQLLLLSAGARAESLRAIDRDGASLANRLLPANARLKTLVGGAMQSLNARLARHALRSAHEWVNDPSRLRALLARWGAEAPPTESVNRTRSDDQAIKEYVRVALRQNSSVTYTSLLRALRTAGRACEQSRFRTLFSDVRDEYALSAESRATAEPGP
jgi:hypothetical protein